MAGGLFVASLWVNPWVATSLAWKFRERCEAFVVSSNSMLPTIAGVHTAGVCPGCGRRCCWHCLTNRLMTCRLLAQSVCARPVASCSMIGAGAGELVAHSPDRFLVNKRIHPQRRDLIVFPCPDDPDELYVMRLVGLPGERVELSGRDVKIDGQVLARPVELQYLHYVELPRSAWWPGWGQREMPRHLRRTKSSCWAIFRPEHAIRAVGPRTTAVVQPTPCRLIRSLASPPIFTGHPADGGFSSVRPQ